MSGPQKDRQSDDVRRTITDEIFRAKIKWLSTCTIGRIESTTKRSVIANPDPAAPFSQSGVRRETIGIANITRYVNA
jgi:hypothetical protein